MYLSRGRLRSVPSASIANIERCSGAVCLAPSGAAVFFSARCRGHVTLSGSRDDTRAGVMRLCRREVLYTLVRGGCSVSLYGSVTLYSGRVRGSRHVGGVGNLLCKCCVNTTLSVDRGSLEGLGVLGRVGGVFTTVLTDLSNVTARGRRGQLESLFAGLGLFSPIHVRLGEVVRSASVSARRGVRGVVAAFGGSACRRYCSGSFRSLLCRMRGKGPGRKSGSTVA